MDENQSSDKKLTHNGHRNRLKESYIKNGCLDAFHEHQILELLLFYAIPRRDVNPLSHQLIDRFGSLHGVLGADYNELLRFGLSPNAATLIKLANDIYPMSERMRFKNKFLNNTSDAMEFCFSLLSKSKNECICIISLNAKSKLLNYDIISVGTPCEASFSPRRVVETAISSGASAIVLAHNHPSGNCAPSADDLENTRRISRLLNEIGIQLQEHIIVAFPNCHAMLHSVTKQMVQPKGVIAMPQA